MRSKRVRIFFTWIGIANTAPEGVIPDSVKWSFYIGAAILILCCLYTFLTVKELNPQEYAEFHGISQEPSAKSQEEDKGFVQLLKEAPSAFWTVGLVQFFCWAAFVYMWTYSIGAIADNCWSATQLAIQRLGEMDAAAVQALMEKFHIETMSDLVPKYAASMIEYQNAGNWVGVVFCVQAVGSLLWAAFLPKLEHWFGNKGAYAISLLVGAVGFVSVYFVHDQYILWLSYALIGAAWAAMLALPFTIVTNAIKGGNMGYYLGLFNCTICVPQIVAALCGGLLLKYICAHVQAGMLVVAGVLLILGAGAVFLIKEKEETKPEDLDVSGL